MLDILETYQPKIVVDQFKAVQVSEDNMHDVADWAGGKVQMEFRDGETLAYIEIQTAFRTYRAYAGYYVMQKPNHEVQVYQPESFEKRYEKAV